MCCALEVVLLCWPISRWMLSAFEWPRLTTFASRRTKDLCIYEQFDWGVKGEQWRRFAAAALSELELCRTR